MQQDNETKPVLPSLPKELNLLLRLGGPEGRGEGRQDAFPAQNGNTQTDGTHSRVLVPIIPGQVPTTSHRSRPSTSACHCFVFGLVKFTSSLFSTRTLAFNTAAHARACRKTVLGVLLGFGVCVSFFYLFEVIKTNHIAVTTVWRLNSKLCFQAQQGLMICLQ